MSLLTPVLGLLGCLGTWHVVFLGRDVWKHKNHLEPSSSVLASIVGFIVNFFDALGIGSFAPSTAIFKGTKLVKDRVIPGTLNVANTVAAMAQAFIFTKIIVVEPITLISMICSAIIGAWVGAGIISKMNTRSIQRIMGIALFVVAFIMFAGLMEWFPIGGDAIGLEGAKLIIGILGNFVLGVFMTAGIGLYAPCMALVYFLGMSPKVAFPIMMGSCAFLMPVASTKFIKEGAYNRKVSLLFSIFGLLGVLCAAFIFSKLDIYFIKMLVIIVITYTSVVMLKDGFGQSKVAHIQTNEM